MSQYTLSAQNENAKHMAAGWLLLGVASLAAAGIFSILLVLSRTPSIQELIPLIDFFHVALVVHVDLSVLIWFMSFAGVLWSLIAVEKRNICDKTALYLAITGTCIIVVAPFLGIGTPLMNNYIPILDHAFYITGLGVFGTGIFILTIRTLLSYKSLKSVLQFAIYVAAIPTLLAIISLALSYRGIPDDWQGKDFYEMLFWGGGHVLQFTHTILLLAAWLWLASASGAVINLPNKAGKMLFMLVALPVIATFFIYLSYDIVSAEHREGFTQLMRYGGLASIPLGLMVIWSLVQSGNLFPKRNYLRSSLLCSIFLFAAGGIIGFLIDGINVVIPAHYHGSIVGVTLAFMGLTYLLLPKLGFAEPSPKYAHIQPYIYGGGQLLHIIGLAWSGGYGVQRKTAGKAQALENLPEIAGMAMMGMGGLISIIGGLIFVVVAIKSIRKKHKR